MTPARSVLGLWQGKFEGGSALAALVWDAEGNLVTATKMKEMN